MNPIECHECLLDRASSGNLNFTVISSYTGCLEESFVTMAMRRLQEIHPLLRVNLSFQEIATSAVFKEFAYQGPDQWRAVAKQELRERFSQENLPLWRVVLLKGEEEGQLLVTFYHAIADGVCAMPFMDHFYRMLNSLLLGRTPSLKCFSERPNLQSLYRLTKESPKPSALPPAREDLNYHTNFLLGTLPPEITTHLTAWGKQNNVRMNAILFAALIQAVRSVCNTSLEEVIGMTIVNYRPYLNPPLSKEVLSLLRTALFDTFSTNVTFLKLTTAIHNSVYSQLAQGKHALSFKALEEKMARNPSPQELWQGLRAASNVMCITNIGVCEFSGEYTKLTMKDLFFVANVELFIESPTNFVLGAVTLRDTVYLTLWFIEELVPEEMAQPVLAEIIRILTDPQVFGSPPSPKNLPNE